MGRPKKIVFDLEKRKNILDLAILKGWYYNLEDGNIYTNRHKITSLDKDGYRKGSINIDGKIYSFRCHHLAYYIYHNKLVDVLDHIDGDRANNKINNLRPVTIQQNSFNRKTAKGYSWCKAESKWKSKIKVDNTSYHLGYFEKEKDARNAYLKAKEKYHLIN